MRRRLVIDASVAVKWFVPEERSADADALASSGNVLLAPNLIHTEVANAFVKKIAASLVTAEDAVTYLSVLPRYFSEQVAAEGLLPDALRLASAIGHPIYDCIYLAGPAARCHPRDR